MRGIYLVLGIFLFFAACQNNQKEVSEVEPQEIDLIEDEFEDEVEIIIPIGNFSGFTFRCTENCGNKGVSIDTMNKYGMRTPFNIKKEESGSTLKVEFSFIDDCCLKHKGIANLDHRTLNLTYANISHEVCECWCEYRYLFSTNKITDFDTLKLNGIVIH